MLVLQVHRFANCITLNEMPKGSASRENHRCVVSTNTAFVALLSGGPVTANETVFVHAQVLSTENQQNVPGHQQDQTSRNASFRSSYAQGTVSYSSRWAFGLCVGPKKPYRSYVACQWVTVCCCSGVNDRVDHRCPRRRDRFSSLSLHSIPIRVRLAAHQAMHRSLRVLRT